MKKYFMQNWLLITVVALLIISSAVIYARGGFETEKIAGNVLPASTNFPAASSTNSPTPSLTPTNSPKPTPTIAPLITPIPTGTIPSIIRVGEEEDD